MATIQVKRLKAILKNYGIKENVHLTKYPRKYKNPETGRIERFNEYGPAFAVILKEHWTSDQLDQLKADPNIEVTSDSDLFLHIAS